MAWRCILAASCSVSWLTSQLGILHHRHSSLWADLGRARRREARGVLRYKTSAFPGLCRCPDTKSESPPGSGAASGDGPSGLGVSIHSAAETALKSKCRDAVGGVKCHLKIGESGTRRGFADAVVVRRGRPGRAAPLISSETEAADVGVVCRGAVVSWCREHHDRRCLERHPSRALSLLPSAVPKIRVCS